MITSRACVACRLSGGSARTPSSPLESVAYTKAHSLCPAVQVWTRVMTCSHHCSATQNHFSARNIPGGHLFIPPQCPQTPDSCWSCYCLCIFALSRMSRSWNSSVRGLFRPVYFCFYMKGLFMSTARLPAPILSFFVLFCSVLFSLSY